MVASLAAEGEVSPSAKCFGIILLVYCHMPLQVSNRLRCIVAVFTKQLARETIFSELEGGKISAILLLGHF